MDLFGMGMGEILLVLVVALIIWGPGRIVEIGRTLGKLMRTLKKASFDLTAQLSRELEGEEKDRPSQSSGGKSKQSSDVESGDAGTTSPGDQLDVSDKK